ncbi:hypothetical protein FQN52_007839 [Onygenales sp. PD_12]|nr:hypothetical protein FQN52_007839 [Onygenales sp. PD_12]
MMRLPAASTKPWRASNLVTLQQVRLFSKGKRAPIINIQGGTFYREYPRADLPPEDNPPLFPNLHFSLPSAIPDKQPPLGHYAVIGTSGKAAFLNVLRGRYICLPPTARSYPYLSSDEIAAKDPSLRSPAHAIQYVGFNGDQKQSAGGVRGSYLSARYESRREDTDFTVLQYLKGQTELNPLEEGAGFANEDLLNKIIEDLQLNELLNMPVSNLSNGQTRRTRIAKALLEKPEVLLLDEPFMGLDPSTVPSISDLLYRLSTTGSPRIVLSLRPQDPVPDWISHLVILGPDHTVALQGDRNAVAQTFRRWKNFVTQDVKSALKAENDRMYLSKAEERTYNSMWGDEKRESNTQRRRRKIRLARIRIQILRDFGLLAPQKVQMRTKVRSIGKPIIEMDGVRVQYGDKTVLGNWTQEIDGEQRPGLFWEVRRGQRWGVFGLNGSGKTTLVSLITSDHPQAYSLPIKLFGRSRLPEPGKPGISIFDLQKRIGHSSPEIHAFFPRTLSVRAAIESAWAETFLSKPSLTQARTLDVDAALRFFEADLNPSFTSQLDHEDTLTDQSWSTTVPFSTLTIAQQRLVLFLRAIVHKPDLVILDEALGGMPPLLRDKCLHFLEAGEIPEKPSTGSQHSVDPRRTWHLPHVISKPGYVRRHTGLSPTQALIVISHVREEVPNIVDRWMRLPSALPAHELSAEEAAKRIDFRTGKLRRYQTVAKHAWEDIWAPAAAFEDEESRVQLRGFWAPWMESGSAVLTKSRKQEEWERLTAGDLEGGWGDWDN